MDTMVDGSLADYEAVVHPDAVNHEANNAPPASHGRGPAAFHHEGGPEPLPKLVLDREASSLHSASREAQGWRITSTVGPGHRCAPGPAPAPG